MTANPIHQIELEIANLNARKAELIAIRTRLKQEAKTDAILRAREARNARIEAKNQYKNTPIPTHFSLSNVENEVKSALLHLGCTAQGAEKALIEVRNDPQNQFLAFEPLFKAVLARVR